MTDLATFTEKQNWLCVCQKESYIRLKLTTINLSVKEGALAFKCVPQAEANNAMYWLGYDRLLYMYTSPRNL